MFAEHLRKAGKAAARGMSNAVARGMTLIEIMVVLVILGLIAGAIGYNVFQSLKDAQVKGDPKAIELLKAAAAHMPMTADVLVGAIAQQFPEKFAS